MPEYTCSGCPGQSESGHDPSCPHAQPFEACNLPLCKHTVTLLSTSCTLWHCPPGPVLQTKKPLPHPQWSHPTIYHFPDPLAGPAPGAAEDLGSLLLPPSRSLSPPGSRSLPPLRAGGASLRPHLSSLLLPVALPHFSAAGPDCIQERTSRHAAVWRSAKAGGMYACRSCSLTRQSSSCMPGTFS